MPTQDDLIRLIERTIWDKARIDPAWGLAEHIIDAIERAGFRFIGPDDTIPIRRNPGEPSQ